MGDQNHDSGRQLSPLQLQFIAIGGSVGSGLLVGSGQALRATGPGLVVAYLLAAAVIYLVARCLSELMLNVPVGGSFVDSIRDELGDRWGFIGGWLYWTSLVLVGMAELSAIGLLAQSLAARVPQWAVIAMVLSALLLLNLASPGWFGRTELWLASIKVAVVVSLIALAAFVLIAPERLAARGLGMTSPLARGFLPTGWHGFVVALPVAPMSLGGFELVGMAAASTRDPASSLPRAINGLLVRYAIIFVGATAALLLLVPWAALRPGASPFAYVMEKLGLPYSGTVFTLVLISALMSSANAIVFGGSRTLASLATGGAAPAVLSASEQRVTPRRAVAFTMGRCRWRSPLITRCRALPSACSWKAYPSHRRSSGL